MEKYSWVLQVAIDGLIAPTLQVSWKNNAFYNKLKFSDYAVFPLGPDMPPVHHWVLPPSPLSPLQKH